MNDVAAIGAAHPGWWELLRALWPVFLVIATLSIGGIVLALKSMFATTKAHSDHNSRLVFVETFVIEQKTAISILPSRQQLGDQIAHQGDKIAEVKDELSEQIAELGARMTGVETASRGTNDQLRTLNPYLHTLIDRGMRS